ncbi:phage portal protein [Alkalicoccobacillus porphyridii]|uniref:Phage portal protein n=1 Tax=Alkalicoccobacillus porphyridii TaxID=2597270 RepID=A0A554A0H5_9BACI|nr:phage portal protein [Alkalicoccobacillus porphyridii]
MAGLELKTLNDHPKINIDPKELARIKSSFSEYRGDHPQIEYFNSQGKLEKRDYMYINMMKLSAELLSGLVFNEQCEINISANKAEGTGTDSLSDAHKFIEHVFEHNDFKKNLMRYLEPTFATGGLTVRPYVNHDNGEIEFSWALADAFYPLRSNSNGISEGVMIFTTTKMKEKKTIYYTLLEFHEWKNDKYIVKNELYKSSNASEIGKETLLSEIYDEMEETAEINGLSRPNFNYLKPAGFNNISPLSPLGLGITDNSKPTLRKINNTYDQFNWEIEMGQRTVFVNDSVLQTMPAENGKPPKQVFDPKVNVYKSMRMSDKEKAIVDVTGDIRTQQYIAAINQSLKTLEMQLQLSVGTFSFDGKSVKTATEIVSENSLTYRTRNNHVNEVEKFIKGLIVSVLELAKFTNLKEGKRLYTGEIPSFEHIGVDFDDGIFTDKEAQLNFYGKAKSLGFIPAVEAIQRVFKVPKEVAEDWVRQMEAEQFAMDPMEIANRSSQSMFGNSE